MADPNPKNRIVNIPAIKQNVVLVPREQLRRRPGARKMKSLAELLSDKAALPTPPATFDWGQAGKTTFPILGNDRYGDCYYVAVAHAVQTWTAIKGVEWQPDLQALINRYLKISGGDNGLSDQDIMPEWIGGIIGPNGPHKILDEMTVSTRDDAAIGIAMWAFGGLVYTCALLNTWLRNPQPGQTWTNDGRPDQGAGHAMFLSGINAQGNYDCQTWGFAPPIRLTPAGMRASDPELIVAFSIEHFDAQGVCKFTGLSYDAKAALWQQLGGDVLPPSPFGPTPPAPPIPPAPPVTQGIEVFQSISPGSYTLLTVEMKRQVADAMTKILSVFPNDSVVAVPGPLLDRLRAQRLTFAQLLRIVALLIQTIESGPITAATVAALVQAILAILEGP